MSTFAKSFKDEVTRLARKETKVAVAPIRKPAGATRSTMADLKRRVAALEQETRHLAGLLSKLPPLRPSASAGQLSPSSAFSLQPSDSASKTRITGKGMRALRHKLRLSAVDFARLLDVTGQAVHMWEKRNGPLRVRHTTRAAILAIRTLGAREAKARLQTLARK